MRLNISLAYQTAFSPSLIKIFFPFYPKEIITSFLFTLLMENHLLKHQLAVCEVHVFLYLRVNHHSISILDIT